MRCFRQSDRGAVRSRNNGQPRRDLRRIRIQLSGGNIYAANMAAAAMRGVRLSKLEPLATSVFDPSISAPPSEVFDKCYDGGGLFDLGGLFFSGVGADVVSVTKTRANPNMLTERQMTGPNWDKPKILEVQLILYKPCAAEKVPADNPGVASMRVVNTMWTG